MKYFISLFIFLISVQFMVYACNKNDKKITFQEKNKKTASDLNDQKKDKKIASNSEDKKKVRTIGLPGTVALTFDDGPSPEFTPQVLDILKKYNVKATFFVMGWSAKKFSHLIKRMKDEGHSVAHHTNAHKLNETK